MEITSEFLLQETGLTAWSFVLLCAVSFLGSFISATLGLGGGMLTLASMAMFLTPGVLIPVHGAVQLGSNIGRTALMFREVKRSILPVFLLGTVLGAFLGGNLVVALPIPVLKTTLAGFILYTVWAPKFQASKPGQMTFFFVAALSSFVTMFVGATGPLVAPFVRAASNTRQQMVATHGALMTLQHLLKIMAFGVLGFTFGPYIPLLTGLLAFGFAGTYVGKRMLHLLPEKLFHIGLNAVLSLMAARLLWDALFQSA